MGASNFVLDDSKQQLTYYKAIFIYALLAIAVIFLVSIGVAQELLSWNRSVFTSTFLMILAMFFYFRTTLKRSYSIGREKDAMDSVRSWLNNQNIEKLPLCNKILFNTDRFFEEEIGNSDFSETFVASYFRDLGNRIEIIYLKAKDTNLADRQALIKIDDLRFCFYANMERLIKPLVNSGTKLLFLGFLGTVVGILLIGLGMRFGETAQQTVLIATELIGGLGVAALTTILGIIGRFILGSFYEQHEDIRDRLLSELTRITSNYGLDLCEISTDNSAEVGGSENG